MPVGGADGSEIRINRLMDLLGQIALEITAGRATDLKLANLDDVARSNPIFEPLDRTSPNSDGVLGELIWDFQFFTPVGAGKVGDDRYRFFHDEALEYLAAWHLRSVADEEAVAELAGHPRGIAVISMLAERAAITSEHSGVPDCLRRCISSGADFGFWAALALGQWLVSTNRPLDSRSSEEVVDHLTCITAVTDASLATFAADLIAQLPRTRRAKRLIGEISIGGLWPETEVGPALAERETSEVGSALLDHLLHNYIGAGIDSDLVADLANTSDAPTFRAYMLARASALPVSARLAVATAMSGCVDDETTPLVLPLLADRDPWVAHEVAKALLTSHVLARTLRTFVDQRTWCPQEELRLLSPDYLLNSKEPLFGRALLACGTALLESEPVEVAGAFLTLCDTAGSWSSDQTRLVLEVVALELMPRESKQVTEVTKAILNRLNERRNDLRTLLDDIEEWLSDPSPGDSDETEHPHDEFRPVSQHPSQGTMPLLSLCRQGQFTQCQVAGLAAAWTARRRSDVSEESTLELARALNWAVLVDLLQIDPRLAERFAHRTGLTAEVQEPPLHDLLTRVARAGAPRRSHPTPRPGHCVRQSGLPPRHRRLRRILGRRLAISGLRRPPMVARSGRLDVKSFCHLHVHTEHGKFGSSRISDYVAAASADGQLALAITDHDRLHGALRFARDCRDAGIKPVLGMELSVAVYEAPTSSLDHSAGEPTNPRAPVHLTLLARPTRL